jgi:hypothetical protein
VAADGPVDLVPPVEHLAAVRIAKVEGMAARGEFVAEFLPALAFGGGLAGGVLVGVPPLDRGETALEVGDPIVGRHRAPSFRFR